MLEDVRKPEKTELNTSMRGPLFMTLRPRKIKVLGCKLIGKILKGSNEIIKTRPKKPAAPKACCTGQGCKISCRRLRNSGFCRKTERH